ncbi:MAG: segregation ATPase FtsK/SpoIIIE, family [Eubacteriales bacterium]|nr:segregation ATPase FtsK/SpoIIIE, family [Eubacteriales bacterium]
MARAEKRSREETQKMRPISGRRVSGRDRGLLRELAGLAFLAAALFLWLSLFTTATGLLGKGLARLLAVLFGEGKLLFPLIFVYYGIAMILKKEPGNSGLRGPGVIVLFLGLMTLFHLDALYFSDQVPDRGIFELGLKGQGGGLTGALLFYLTFKLFGLVGTYVLLAVSALAGAVMLTDISLGGLLQRVGQKLRLLWQKGKERLIDFLYTEVEEEEAEEVKKEEEERESSRQQAPVLINGELFASSVGKEPPSFPEEKPGGTGPVVNIYPLPEKDKEDKEEKIKEGGKGAAPGVYRLPPVDLLQRGKKAKPQRLNRDIAENVRLLEETLESFGIKARVTHVSCGPAVTRYELAPAPGVKVSRIVSLADDIALNLAAPGVRIEAPIPGKAALGIEVPNREIQPVHLRELIETQEFQDAPSKLTVALGKDVAGNPVFADLARMPHLLIAGATGSGKSVCMNTIIASILFKATPDEVRFVMIDPKMVELTAYNGIPHLIAPVVTNPKKAAAALRWAVREMERRYEMFALHGVKDMERYNASLPEGEKPLPQIVVVIDELADLMMVAPAEVEDAICRLAQMARAAGIHLVVATQRPSVDVITGLIKANIPSRISFAVSSQTDSRTILDMAGAEKLLGRGDMLFFPVGAPKPVRVQGAYLSDQEVEALVEYIKGQVAPVYEEITAITEEEGEGALPEEEDELLPQAARVVVEAGQASVSLLQRRLRIGYARAARLIDALEQKGIVGGYEGSKPRAVLINMEQYRRLFGEMGSEEIER